MLAENPAMIDQSYGWMLSKPELLDLPTKRACVPVHTLLRWSVSMTSCTPGRCAPPPFMQTQFIKSSQLGIFFWLRRCCK